VIYDAAHTFGETYKGKGVGTFGDASCYSFHATKVFNTAEGGAVCFSDETLGARLYDLKNFGIHGPEEVSAVGANAKMNELCAAMGLCNLRHVDDEIAKRKAVAERYRERLEGIEGLQLNAIQKDVKPNYGYFPVIFHEKEFGSSRAEVDEALKKENIFARKYFYPLTNTFSCFHGKYDVSRTPVARTISKRVLTLPLYADLPLEAVDEICDIILGMRK
jgi:dTDP-4-amino-4,6-dideoxygalactose transaminase